MRRLFTCCLMAVLGLLAATPASPLAANTPAPQPSATVQATATPQPDEQLFRFYEQTGHNLGPPFKGFYDAHGGLQAFGLPLTEVLTDTSGLRFQWFERARLDLPPDAPAAQVVVADLGRQRIAGRSEAAFEPQPTPDATQTAFWNSRGIVHFPETGHTLRAVFRTFWEAHGGLPILGYPVSTLLKERDETGAQVAVQYFERARLEYRPEFLNDPRAVQQGLIGRELLARQPLPAALLAAVPPIEKLAEATTPSYLGSPESINILLAAERLNGVQVAPGETFSFMEALGDTSAAAGYVPGGAIVGGQVVQEIAGGICQISSIAYETALFAGLPITERHNHSLLLSFFAEKPGIEAAVYEGYQDMRWRNDMPLPVTIATSHDPATGLITLALWGPRDGRVVTVAPPQSFVLGEAGPPVWTLDETMAPGEARQLAQAQPGVQAITARTIANKDGQLLASDEFVSTYAPGADMFSYGPGVQPPTDEAPACLLPPEGEESEAPLPASDGLALEPCTPPEPTPEATPEPLPADELAPTDGATPEPSPVPVATLEPIWTIGD